MRNLKLFNHWIAEVREIAKAAKCVNVEDDETMTPMTKSDLKWHFDKASMGDYFKEGLTPQKAFEEEVSNWEYGN